MVFLAPARNVGLAVALLIAARAPVTSAQPVTTGPASGKVVRRMAQPLDFDRLGYADGMPQGNVQAMVQDPRGFMWLGTQDGLARYDGTKVHVYRPIENDPTSISTGYITALTLDADGKLWIGTDNKGVNLYDPDTDRFTRFTNTATAGSLSSEGVNAIERDPKGRMWFAMSGGGLNRLDPAKGGFAEYTSAPLDVTITSLDTDAAGNLWLGTAASGLIRWNPDDASTTKYTNDDLSAAGINAVVVGSDGRVWAGTEGEGLYALDPKTGKLVRYRHDPTSPDTVSHDHISALFEDRDKALWVATHNGLTRIASTGGLVQYHHDPNDPTSISYPWVTAIYQDRGGVMWFGAKARGAYKFHPLRPKFGHYRTRTDTANSFFEETDGTLWVGTYHGGLYKFERSAKRVTTWFTLGAPGTEGSLQLASAWISDLHRDSQGTLWIATRELGLIAFDTKAETFKQYKANPDDAGSLPNDSIWDIWEDRDNGLWLATWGGGLVRLDLRTNAITDYTIEDGIGLTSNHLYRLYPDPKESKILWIGTAKGGLVRFDMATKTATSIRHKDDDPASLSSDDVLAIHREPGGNIWAGTYGGGLTRLDPASGRGQRFTTSTSALTSDVVLGILADDTGKLWVSTNGGGLVQLDTETGKFLVFDSTDGVQDIEFGQGSFMRSKSGELFFGGVGGFNAFFPKNITRDSYVPPVTFTGLKVFNEEVKLENPIWTAPRLEVSHSDSFELKFAALAYAAPGKNRYAYKLEGFDDEFVETDRPYATYTKLSGGNYVLRVRASNQHGVWNEEGIALELRVEPPFWRTWPAFCIYIGLLALAVYLLYRAQRARLREAEREGRLAVVERDLALTGAVQSGFLPEYNEVNGPHVQLYGFYRAADTCSGDWWWHETLGNGRHVILVGDVTGHGPGPAMVTAAVATAFRVMITSGLQDVRHCLETLNKVVLHVAKGKYHMTMAALELEETTGRWVLHNAGAPPILTLHQNGKHKVHFSAGSPLGTDDVFETGHLEGKLESNERILMYTDGIPEITLPNGNVLGIRKFAQFYERTRSQDLKSAATAIVLEADQMAKGESQVDDWTFAMIEWRQYGATS
jgi:ligand-binding sensor domain-containing protein